MARSPLSERKELGEKLRHRSHRADLCHPHEQLTIRYMIACILCRWLPPWLLQCPVLRARWFGLGVVGGRVAETGRTLNCVTYWERPVIHSLTHWPETVTYRRRNRRKYLGKVKAKTRLFHFQAWLFKRYVSCLSTSSTFNISVRGTSKFYS